MSKRSFNTRLYLIFLSFILSFILLISRLVYIQIFKAPEFRQLASKQHKIFTEISPSRGTIFDRNLVALAINASSYSIFATKQNTISEELRPGLAELLELDEELLHSKLDSEKSFVWLKRKVSPEVSAKVRALGLTGIGYLREKKRFYPNTSLASHIIGFTNIDNKGLEGIELGSDSRLSGIKGWRLAQRDAKKQEVIGWGYKSILPTNGYDVVLTIDSVIQTIVERHLRKAAKKYNVASATAIVLDPKTGEILALYNYPDYDLNKASESEFLVRKNLAVTDIFEPGSSFKFITAAAAIEEGVIAPEDKVFCEEGRYRVGGRILHDHKPYGKISFEKVIAYSSNIGIAKVATKLGKELLYKYIRDFGLGSLTEIDLPGEVRGIIRAPSAWSGASLSSIPMGQEIAVTPIQLINALSCIANDGILLKPKIIHSIQNKKKEVVKLFPTHKLRRVVSSQTATAVKKILAAAVKIGTGKKAQVSGYAVAGKTGTAQKPNPKGGYYKNKYVASFIGFIPVDEPELVILVVLNEPRPRYFGGTVCAPVFKKIATESLRYLRMSEKFLKNKRSKKEQ